MVGNDLGPWIVVRKSWITKRNEEARRARRNQATVEDYGLEIRISESNEPVDRPKSISPESPSAAHRASLRQPPFIEGSGLAEE